MRANTEAAEHTDVKDTATRVQNYQVDLMVVIATDLSVSKVETMIGQAANKTCALGPVPTWLIKQFRHVFGPFIAHFFNASLSTDYISQKQKQV